MPKEGPLQSLRIYLMGTWSLRVKATKTTTRYEVRAYSVSLGLKGGRGSSILSGCSLRVIS